MDELQEKRNKSFREIAKQYVSNKKANSKMAAPDRDEGVTNKGVDRIVGTIKRQINNSIRNNKGQNEY